MKWSWRCAEQEGRVTYEDTWNFIMENGNSLERYCNMSVFFEKLGIRVEGK